MLENTLPRFSIIIVNYKTLDLTRNALQRIRNCIDTKRNPVWVVDNQSGDESTEYLKTLDWIHFIARTPEVGENGPTAHGRAIDLAFHKIDTDYVFLFHTDTFLDDPRILFSMLKNMCLNPAIAAMGCLEQVKRSTLRTCWRYFVRFFKHYWRSIKLCLGIQTRKPKGLYETHIKSFYALWNAKLMKSLQLQFMMNEQNPGYHTQDILRSKGYIIETVAPHVVFNYLDHVQAGTKSLLKNDSTIYRNVQFQ